MHARVHTCTQAHTQTEGSRNQFLSLLDTACSLVFFLLCSSVPFCSISYNQNADHDPLHRFHDLLIDFYIYGADSR